MKSTLTRFTYAARLAAVALFAIALPEAAHAESLGISVSVNSPGYGYGIQSESDFYEPLGAYGRWSTIGSYGRCWIPAGVESGWRPYSNGNWEQTDAGWYWASEEPWGWATYHYGRWNYSSRYGWYWVPRTEWAPAWVSWRSGGDYIGWAALSTRARYDRGRYWDDNDDDHERRYVFTEHRRFHEPVRSNTVIVNNNTVINNTVINEGPDVARIERETGRKFAKASVRELRSKEEAVVVSRKDKTGGATKDREATGEDRQKVRKGESPQDQPEQDVRKDSKKESAKAPPDISPSKNKERSTKRDDSTGAPVAKMKDSTPKQQPKAVKSEPQQTREASPKVKPAKDYPDQETKKRDRDVQQERQQPSEKRVKEQPSQQPRKEQQASSKPSKEKQSAQGKSKKTSTEEEEEYLKDGKDKKKGKGY